MFYFVFIWRDFLLISLSGESNVDITQQDLAQAVGVSRQTINSIESGKYVPSIILSLKIARYFGKPVETVFQLEEND